MLISAKNFLALSFSGGVGLASDILIRKPSADQAPMGGRGEHFAITFSTSMNSLEINSFMNL